MYGDVLPLPSFGFTADVLHWRGPSPYFFLVLPPDLAEEVRDAARAVTYGWGMIPVEAVIGEAAFQTSLFPKDGTYYLPLRDAVRLKADIAIGDRVTVEMTVVPRRKR
ncbi:hypothetical protein FHS91_001397 [Sphingobium xanthum]|jgi:hypothetical protein|uniref:DUF1905 domain-containing protein n=1 Tax=Sphingobium xanthum TaxID=1387165 RepID=UPI001C8C77E8|nr:DUF1905 domain-containing protein [Sphingobium xanthum]